MKLISTIVYWLSWPFIYLVINNTRRTRVVIRHKNEILLVRPILNNGRWDLPGGGINSGEDPAVSACREVSEELSITIKPKELRFIKEIQLVSRFVKMQAIVYEVQLKSKPSIKIQRKELTGAQWANTKTLSSISKSDTLTDVLDVVELD